MALVELEQIPGASPLIHSLLHPVPSDRLLVSTKVHADLMKSGQPILSIQPIKLYNPPYQYNLSTHPINTPYHPLNPPTPSAYTSYLNRFFQRFQLVCIAKQNHGSPLYSTETQGKRTHRR